MKKVPRGSERREIVDELIVNYSVSISQACRVITMDRKTYRYKPKKKSGDQMIESLLKNYSAEYLRIWEII
ncbi:hypothetical protein [Rickettsiella grylli]|uniref:hypothetical protein n=1 Tax=Rickettsiella grylli TaxID=59196 RepID=UPI0003097436|nr:hypothetical protein [Rickettsiella grylli]